MHYWTWWLPAFLVAWLVVYWIVFPNPIGLFAQNWLLIIVGFFIALIGNATAVSGGMIFIPVMTLVYQLPAVASLKVAFASQSFGMTSGAIGWMRRGAIPSRLIWITILPVLAGSTISTLVIHPNAALVKGLFGPVSILIGIITLVLINRSGDQEEVSSRSFLPLGILSFTGGLLTGWVVMGAGELIAAFLMLAYGLKAEKSIGLGVFVLAVNSIYVTILHQVFQGGIPWDIAMFTGLGCVFGGRMGPYVSQWIGSARLKLGFAAIAIINGLIFIVQFIFAGVS